MGRKNTNMTTQEEKTASFTSIVCRTSKIEYTYSREQIQHIKEQLFEKFSEFVENLGKNEENKYEEEKGENSI